MAVVLLIMICADPAHWFEQTTAALGDMTDRSDFVFRRFSHETDFCKCLRAGSTLTSSSPREENFPAGINITFKKPSLCIHISAHTLVGTYRSWCPFHPVRVDSRIWRPSLPPCHHSPLSLARQ